MRFLKFEKPYYSAFSSPRQRSKTTAMGASDATSLHQQESFGFWVSAFLDIVGIYLFVKFVKLMNSEAWNYMIELVVQYALQTSVHPLDPKPHREACPRLRRPSPSTCRCFLDTGNFLILGRNSPQYAKDLDSITSATVEVVLEAVEDAEEAQRWSQLA
ncbi:hypothetical protein P7C70_g6012, partial [Phenoliferia sp. Uapishka_3]